jgi:hypothetical protein
MKWREVVACGQDCWGSCSLIGVWILSTEFFRRPTKRATRLHPVPRWSAKCLMQLLCAIHVFRWTLLVACSGLTTVVSLASLFSKISRYLSVLNSQVRRTQPETKASVVGQRPTMSLKLMNTLKLISLLTDQHFLVFRSILGNLSINKTVKNLCKKGK